MTENDKRINDLIMQEIGLEVGPGNKIYDQDTGLSIRINGADVVAPGFYNGRQTVEFDPFNNRKMMNQLFSHFIEKISDESDRDVVAYYSIDNQGTGRIECSMSDNSKLKSGEYLRDSLKYTDLIIQLNGGENPSEVLKEFDTPVVKTAIKKPRGGARNGRTTKI